jgi:3-keto-5-aminohexanoate cleavage enzyme
MIGSGDVGVAEAEARFSHIDALAARGLIELAALDPGSVNFTQIATTSQANPAGTYLNPESHVRHALGIAGRHGFHPAFAIYEPGFIRAGAALARATGVKTPIYRFMFSQQFAFCFPPKPYALAALATLVEEEAGAAPWMISGLGVDVSPLIGEAVARGGHIRVGLEDALLGTPASTTNLGLVEAACGSCGITAPSRLRQTTSGRRSARSRTAADWLVRYDGNGGHRGDKHAVAYRQWRLPPAPDG